MLSEPMRKGLFKIEEDSEAPPDLEKPNYNLKQDSGLNIGLEIRYPLRQEPQLELLGAGARCGGRVLARGCS